MQPLRYSRTETLIRTQCHYCGQHVAGPAPLLIEWKWQHRLKCHHPTAEQVMAAFLPSEVVGGAWSVVREETLGPTTHH